MELCSGGGGMLVVVCTWFCWDFLDCILELEIGTFWIGTGAVAALSSLVFIEPEPEPYGLEWFGFFAEPEPEPNGFEWFGFYWTGTGAKRLWMVRFLLNQNRSQTALNGSVFTEPEPEPNGFEWFGFYWTGTGALRLWMVRVLIKSEPEPVGFEWFGFNFVSPKILI